MIRVEIKKQGVMTHAGEFSTQGEADAWLQKHISKGTFGLPERVVEVSPEKKVEISPAVYDENGVEVSPAQYEIIPAQYETLPPEYKIVIEDITAQLQQQKINHEAKAYLDSTDWYVVRFMEKGTPVPPEVTEKRELSRSQIV